MKIFVSLLCFTLNTAVASTILIEPATSFVSVGTPAVINVNVSGVADLFAWQFDIDFDPVILSATNVTEGALFSSTGVFFSGGFIDNSGGHITFIGDSLGGTGPGLSADGTLASIQFDTVALGVSSIHLSNIVLLDSTLNDINTSLLSGSVTVTGSQTIPEPGTFVLALPFLAASWSVRRKRSTRSGPALS